MKRRDFLKGSLLVASVPMLPSAVFAARHFLRAEWDAWFVVDEIPMGLSYVGKTEAHLKNLVTGEEWKLSVYTGNGGVVQGRTTEEAMYSLSESMNTTWYFNTHNKDWIYPYKPHDWPDFKSVARVEHVT